MARTSPQTCPLIVPQLNSQNQKDGVCVPVLRLCCAWAQICNETGLESVEVWNDTGRWLLPIGYGVLLVHALV